MVLLGSYRSHPAITMIAASGLVLAAIYSLWIVQHVFHGKKQDALKPDEILFTRNRHDGGDGPRDTLAWPLPAACSENSVGPAFFCINHREHGEIRILDKSKEMKPPASLRCKRWARAYREGRNPDSG